MTRFILWSCMRPGGLLAGSTTERTLTCSLSIGTERCAEAKRVKVRALRTIRIVPHYFIVRLRANVRGPLRTANVSRFVTA